MTTPDMQISVLHCFETYLRTTENWIFRLLKHQAHTNRRVASFRFIQCEFYTSEIDFLRSPLQPSLINGAKLSRIQHWRRTVSSLTYLWYVRMTLRKQRIDVVHSHFAHVAWRYRKLPTYLQARHIVSFYGWDYLQLAAVDPAWKSRLRDLYMTADYFICEGPYGARLLAQQGCPNEKIRVARLGVEPDIIRFIRRKKVPGQLRLLQIASFREKKGHIDTITAFADALQQWPNIDLTLIGTAPGPILDRVMEIVRAHKIENKVTLLPGVRFDELHPIMSDYGVFIHPSRHARDGDCEGGAPIVLLDAQATGMPIIATNHCDIPQEVIDGETGLLCTEGDIPALSAAIGFFCAMDQKAYDKYARAARRHIETHFNAHACAAQVEAIYRECIATQQERSPTCIR